MGKQYQRKGTSDYTGAKRWKIFRGLKAGDLIVFLSIFFLAIMSLLIIKSTAQQGNPVAVVEQNGVEICRIDLDALESRKEIIIKGKYKELIVAEKGRIRFMEAECPDKVCVNTGWISKPGQVAVCLPAGVIIRITGSGDDEVDIYLR